MTTEKPMHPQPLNDYEAQIYEYLNNLLPHDTIVIKSLVKEGNIENFTEIVKKYMRFHVDTGTTPYMNGFSFSNDYTKITKQWQ
ncbi:hypothetical protein JJL45_09075 [Tamlana sp. s12]|uniref:hypothetical protein n=1 Tax=Tamlana sp. s12 TaxID=1630406 RepID=UPI0007FBBA3E|nr:hypothetical protein [Tamlana sp. s12]OBQ52892.1 hypothetical protein VQ01_13165 [Tamlana sp. s12]QQY81081.1 hypothetical protein JJL45_09075 [Tamlana sp. s12]